MARKLSGSCYYCGAKVTSLEHAPPRQMFKGFPCDSITVPSCDDHNSKKSGSDQAIVSAFLIPLRNGAERYPLESEIKFAVEKATPSFERAKRKAVDVPLLSDLPENLASFPNVAHIASSANIRAWVRQLTAALVYDAVKVRDSSIKWGEAIAWSPNFIEANEPIPLLCNHAVSMLTKQAEIKAWLEGLQWLDGWSAHPSPNYSPARKIDQRRYFWPR